MSEILLYKANEVASKLSSAEDVVSSELVRLEQSEQSALSSVAEAYARLEKTIEKAKQNAFKSLSDLAAAKSQVLRQQLDLIRNEKSLVERDVTGRYQIIRWIFCRNGLNIFLTDRSAVSGRSAEFE
jgi:hypothetical protein